MRLRVEFTTEQFDAAIVFGQPTLKGVSSHHLFDEVLTPVCAPGLWKERQAGAATPDDLADQTLLHPTRDRRDWLRWLEAYGYRGLPSAKAQHFDTLDLAISSAMQGLGVTIGDLSLIEEDLQAQRIITPFSLCVPSGASYYLIYPERPAPSPVLREFAEWLEWEAAQTRANLSTLLLLSPSSTSWPIRACGRKATNWSSRSTALWTASPLRSRANAGRALAPS